MKALFYFLFIFSFIVLVSCNEDNSLNINNSDAIIGNWINPVAIDTLTRFERSDTLKSNDYGFSIKKEQKFIERKNAGWCGTPPISYADFNGTWTMNDSTINITVDYWGGVASYEWKLIDIDNIYLTIWVAKTEFPTGE